MNPAWKNQDGEILITAFAEYCFGPGWANQLVTCIVLKPDGGIERRYLQPDEHQLSQLLFDSSAITQKHMLAFLSAKLPKV